MSRRGRKRRAAVAPSAEAAGGPRAPTGAARTDPTPHGEVPAAGRLRTRVAAALEVAVGLVWITAAVAKTARPVGAFDLMVRAVPVGWPSKPLLAAAIGVEAALGAALCVRAIRGRAGMGASLACLGAATAVLLAVRAESGPDLPCGCFGSLLGTTVDGALARNAGLAVIHCFSLALAPARIHVGRAKPPEEP